MGVEDGMVSSGVQEELERIQYLSDHEDGCNSIDPGGNHASGPTTINGYSAGPIDFLNPDPSKMCLHDILRGMAMERRFTGQTETFYSVAEHSVLVLDIFLAMYPEATLDEQRYALFHDGHEGYIGDICSPLARAIDQLAGGQLIAKLKLRMDVAVLLCLGISFPGEQLKARVKEADLRARFCEGRVLCPKESVWETKDNVLPDGVECQFGMNWQEARMALWKRAKDLGMIGKDGDLLSSVSA